MSQMEVAYAERVASAGSVSSASYVQVTDPVIPAASFVAGKKYLLLFRSEAGASANGVQVAIRTRHGSTPFSESECVYSTTTNVNDREPYAYFTVWIAVAGEDVGFEARGDGANSMNHRFSSIVAIRLDDYLVENTDYRYHDEPADHTLTTTAVTGATLTWTPAAGGNTWLVLSSARHTVDNASDEFCSRIDRTGEATGNWELVRGGRSVGEAIQHFNLWVGTLGAVSQTFREQSRRIGTGAATAVRTRSQIIAVNLSKMDAVTVASNDANIEVTDVNQWLTEVLAASHTQLVDNGKALVLGFHAFNPQADTGHRVYTSRMQRNDVDVYAGYSALSAYHRFFYPNPGSSSPNQAWSWLASAIMTLQAGTSDFTTDASISFSGGSRGVKFRRIVVVSLDVATSGGGGGTGTPTELERNEQIMYQSDPVAARRRIMVRCVDATDNVTPEPGEAGGQPSISVNGGAFTSSGVGTLSAHDAANGLYYFDPGVANLKEIGSLRVRYKSTNTALFTAVLSIEPLPYLFAGTATGGGANYVDVTSPPALQPGSIVRITDGTGAGQSMLLKSMSGNRLTVEDNWANHGGTPPASGSYVVVEPGLPPVMVDVSVGAINRDTQAAALLAEGAGALAVAEVVAGANSPTQIVCNLPTIVNGSAVQPNAWKDRGIVMKTGALAGDQSFISGSSVSGANTVLILDPNAPLTGTPAVGARFIVT